VIVSDYHAIAELMAHGVAADLTEAATLALRAGVDIDMMSDAYRTGLPIALARGRVRIAQVDAAVARVLALKERLGLFEDPYRRAGGLQSLEAPAHRARRERAREIAIRSLVLLTNPRGRLPLEPAPGSLAVIGPLADARTEMRGPWWGAADPEDAVTVLAGLRSALPGRTILHAEGVAIEDRATAGIGAALECVERAEAVVLCLGERAEMSGEAASRAHPHLPGAQESLAMAVLERARARGRPVVLVLFGGRPLIVPALIERADATLAAFFLGCEAGTAIAAVLLGHASPAGRLAMSWPRAVGQIPVFFAQRPSGRPPGSDPRFCSQYLDEAETPQFVFGHGLGYGRSRLERLRVSEGRLSPGGCLTIEVDVVHEAGRALEETVLLFVRPAVASIARPVLELRGFTKVRLAPGERVTASLPLAAGELVGLDRALERTWEPGPLEVLVGTRAERAALLSTTIELVAAP